MEKQEIVKTIVECFKNNGKLLIFGNGGSCAEASHLAAEFVGKGFPAIALTDPAVITSLANDFSFKEIFSKQIWAIGESNDIAIAMTTSGKSANVVEGIKMAKAMDITVIEWPRNKGKNTGEIQEHQLKLIHYVYQAVDSYFSAGRV